MSDWQVGDLALCVSIEHPLFKGPSSILRAGAVYTVVVVGSPISWANNERALGFSEAKPKKVGRGFPETLFRKIDRHQPDEFDRETIALMNRVEQPA